MAVSNNTLIKWLKEKVQKLEGRITQLKLTVNDLNEEDRKPLMYPEAKRLSNSDCDGEVISQIELMLTFRMKTSPVVTMKLMDIYHKLMAEGLVTEGVEEAPGWLERILQINDQFTEVSHDEWGLTKEHK